MPDAAALSAVLGAVGPLRLSLIAAYAVFSGVTFVLYGTDKAAARRSGRRTPELTFHLLALAGGWPGALAGQSVFRHKTKKQPFRGIFWTMVVINCALVGWLLFAAPAFPGV